MRTSERFKSYDLGVGQVSPTILFTPLNTMNDQISRRYLQSSRGLRRGTDLVSPPGSDPCGSGSRVLPEVPSQTTRDSDQATAKQKDGGRFRNCSTGDLSLDRCYPVIRSGRYKV
jgi:hypothetical protein